VAAALLNGRDWRAPDPVSVQVTVTGNAPAIFGYSGLPYSGDLAAKATMRVQ